MILNSEFHHIGYAVKNIQLTADVYIKQGWSTTETVIDNIQNVKICFLFKNNMPLIELIEPIDEFSPTNQFLNKNGVSTYHICYKVENIIDAIKEYRKLKFIPLFSPVEANALNNKKICYLYNSNIGLIEIVE